MNNLEIECLNLIKDFLCNLPKNIKGEKILYKKEDKEKIAEIIKEQKNKVEFCKDKLSKGSYNILIQLFDAILDIVKE